MIYSYNSLFETGVIGLIFFSVSFVLSAFSPFGIGFIISTIARAKAESEGAKKIAFVFQIILLAITFLLGIVASIVAPMLIFGTNSWQYQLGRNVTALLSIFFGVMLAVAIEIGVMIWQGRND